jgi:FtsZ-binding cell division protein ZapB
MATSRQDPEVDSLGHLEERIQKAVALVIRLRQELAESQNTNAHLAAEIEELRSERQQVRGRIEKLLGHIDQLGSAT